MTMNYAGNPANQCWGKAQYRTKPEAKTAARQLMTVVGGSLIQPYRCVWCGWLHIGHAQGTRMLARRTREATS